MKSPLHEAGRQAALDERDRLHSQASDYVIGRCVEAYAAVVEGRPIEDPDAFIDVDSSEAAQ